MRLPYLAARTTQPVPTLGGSYLRYRPIIAVQITGPALAGYAMLSWTRERMIH